MTIVGYDVNSRPVSRKEDNARVSPACITMLLANSLEYAAQARVLLAESDNSPESKTRIDDSLIKLSENLVKILQLKGFE